MKKSLFRKGHLYFHINVDFNTHPIFKDLDWIFVQKKINQIVLNYKIELHALVMMDTHLHILIQSNLKNENYFCENLKLALKTSSNEIDCHCEPIPNYTQYLNTYKYIYRNPVEADLVKNVEDYPHSTLRILLGQAVSHCEIIDHLGLIQNPIQHLNWMNNKQSFKFSKLNQFELGFTLKLD